MTFDTNLPSIVAVRAHVPDDAFTARTLGELREGSGVVCHTGERSCFFKSLESEGAAR